jgi:hypothetical protein
LFLSPRHGKLHVIDRSEGLAVGIRGTHS